MSSELKINETFDSMNLKEQLLRGILSYGYEKPSIVQTKGIVPVIEGNDCIIQAQSGTGKTATFSISILQLVDPEIKSCQAIILNPTREIADQTLHVIKTLGHYLKLNIMGVIGGKNINYNTIGDMQILVATPGRIFDMIEKGFINMSTLKIIVLDEADQMLDKGFKEQLNDIFKYVNKTSQISIYSATMPKDILYLSEQFMKDPLKILIKKEQLTLEGIKQFYIILNNEQDKYCTLIDLYQSLFIGQSIIYCNSKKKVSWLTEKLNEIGYSISSIHGDIPQKERDEIMIKFRKNITRVLITTDLLARGIDVQQVSLVINYDLPRDRESYIHRIGRTGRYGRKGVAINLIGCDNDIKQLTDIQKFYNTQIDEMPANIENYLV